MVINAVKIDIAGQGDREKRCDGLGDNVGQELFEEGTFKQTSIFHTNI